MLSIHLFLQIYDPNDPIDNFIDTEDDTPTIECPHDFTGHIPYAMDCRQYLNCWHGHGTIQSCSPGTMFNPRTMECDHPSKVKCRTFDGFSSNRGKSNHGRFQRQQQQVIQCERGSSGLQPHPIDCAKFLNCDHGRTFIQDCGPGTLFNPLYSVCDWPQNVDCGLRNINGNRPTTTDVDDGYYGEGSLDARSDMNRPTVRQPTRPQFNPNHREQESFQQSNQHNRRFPANDIRNQRRFPDSPPPLSQSNNNSFNNSFSSSQFPSRPKPNDIDNNLNRNVFQHIQPPPVAPLNNNNGNINLNQSANDTDLNLNESVNNNPFGRQNNNVQTNNPNRNLPPNNNFNTYDRQNVNFNSFGRPNNIQPNNNPILPAEETLGRGNNNVQISALPNQNFTEDDLDIDYKSQNDNGINVQQQSVDPFKSLNGSVSNNPQNGLDDIIYSNTRENMTSNNEQGYDERFGEADEDSYRASQSQNQLFHQSLTSPSDSQSQLYASIENVPSQTDEIPNEFRQNHPELNYLSSRTKNDFQKFFMNSNQNTPPTVQIQTTTETVRLAPFPTPNVHDRVKSVYPSGFETLGTQCEELGAGLTQHPYDCSKYVSCENGKMTVQNCEAGFLFNPDMKMCDFARNVKNCPSNSAPPTSIGDLPSTFAQRNDVPIEERPIATPNIKNPLNRPNNANSNVNQQRVTNNFIIPDMSVLPLSNSGTRQYPEDSFTSYSNNQYKPSNGADIPPDTLDDIIKKLSTSDREADGQWNRVGKEFVYVTPKSVQPLSTTTEKKNVMKIPSGKEHVMPIYHRPTTTARTTVKPPQPLESYNQIYYKPFSNPPSNVEQQTDYMPVSEALKLLLRPYLNKNETKSPNGEQVAKIEDTILDMMDESKNVKTNHTAALEQDSLAAASFGERVEVENLPDLDERFDHDVESLTKKTSLLTTTTEAPQIPKSHNRIHYPQEFTHRPFGSRSPFSPDFKHSPEYHARFDKQFPHPNANHNYPHDLSKPESNHMNFPGPTNHLIYNQAHGRHHPPPFHHDYPPQMTHNSNYHNRYPHHHPNSHPKPEWQNTTPLTASAPAPPYYSQIDPRMEQRGNFEVESIETCQQFDCQNDLCIPFSKVMWHEKKNNFFALKSISFKTISFVSRIAL